MTSMLAVSSLANARSAAKQFALCAMFHVSFNAALADPANTALRPVDVASTQGLHAILKVSGYTLTTRRTPGRYALLLRHSAGQTAEFPMPDRPWNVAAAALSKQDWGRCAIPPKPPVIYEGIWGTARFAKLCYFAL